jgi:LysM repeat protein
MPAQENHHDPADAAPQNHATSKPRGARRSRKILASIPVVMVSAIAMTLHMVSPADAAPHTKKPLKAKTTPSGVSASAAAASSAPASITAAPRDYLVVEGDTISGIAGRFGLSTASVLALNGLGWQAVIFPGQKLILSVQSTGSQNVQRPASPASEISRYTIKSGDTISGIASAHGLTTTAVLRANGLSTSSVIFPGQAIVLPENGAGASSPAEATPVAEASEIAATYTIVGGDTISGVASRLGISVQAILDANGLSWESMIYPGQNLAIPSGHTVVATVAVTPQVSAARPSAPASQAADVVALTTEMRRNADTIISIGRSMGISDYGIVIALAAAAQESGLRNIEHGDRDSLGLFQQRPSSGWGTPEQVKDPQRATRAFFGGPSNPNDNIRGLLDISGWESMSVTDAAQAVQISGHPDLYAKWESSARAWLAELG